MTRLLAHQVLKSLQNKIVNAERSKIQTHWFSLSPATRFVAQVLHVVTALFSFPLGGVDSKALALAAPSDQRISRGVWEIMASYGKAQ